MTEIISLTLKPDVKKRIDNARGDVPRSKYISNVLEMFFKENNYNISSPGKHSKAFRGLQNENKDEPLTMNDNSFKSNIDDTKKKSDKVCARRGCSKVGKNYAEIIYLKNQDGFAVVVDLNLTKVVSS